MLHIRLLTAADIPFGLHLTQQAGWNTTELDWFRALDLEPGGCFVAEWQSEPVGTATACCFGSVAWIALVLVDAAARNQGVGTALMRHMLAYLDGQGVDSVCLTATPLGQPIYEKLGFVGEYPLARYHGTPAPAAPVEGVEAVAPAQLDELAHLESVATGIDRSKLLRRAYAERPEAMRLLRRDGRVAGFLTARFGVRAIFIGPCLADADAGPVLLADAFQRYAGQPVFIDLPLDNAKAVALAEARGLTQQRRLLRMWRGPRIAGSLAGIWASWGAEKG